MQASTRSVIFVNGQFFLTLVSEVANDSLGKTKENYSLWQLQLHFKVPLFGGLANVSVLLLFTCLCVCLCRIRQCARLPIYFSPEEAGEFDAILAVRTQAGHQTFAQLKGKAFK